MSRENDRIDYIGRSERAFIDSLRYEIVWTSGAFSFVESMKPRDIEQLIEKGFDTTIRTVILSQVLLPQVCSIVGRGLTTEEIGLLTGTSTAEVKMILKKLSIKQAIIIKAEKVDRSKFTKVHVPLRSTVLNSQGTVEERPIKEPLLAPKRLVEEIRRNGYLAKDGRVLRNDYLSMVSGPLPTVYMFWNIGEVARENIGKAIGRKEIEELFEDQTVTRAGLEMSIAQMGMLKSIFDSEQASLYFEQLANFFHETYENVVHYACRYRALNDLDTFSEIVLLAGRFHCTAEGIGHIASATDKELRRTLIEAIDEVITEFKAVIDCRASLLP